MLKNRNVLLIGATGGIGQELTGLLIQSGANVFITGRSETKLQVMAKKFSVSKDRMMAVDLLVESQIISLRQHYFESLESLDILINCSGAGIIKPTDELTAQDFSRSVGINLVAPFLILKEFLPSMKQAKKGLIIHIPGVLGKVPMSGAAAYSASKYGLVGMLQSIREEIKRTDIRVTNLFLGGTSSPFWDDIEMRVQRDKMITSEDAAKAIWYLCQQPPSGVVNEMVLQPFNHQLI